MPGTRAGLGGQGPWSSDPGEELAGSTPSGQPGTASLLAMLGLQTPLSLPSPIPIPLLAQGSALRPQSLSPSLPPGPPPQLAWPSGHPPQALSASRLFTSLSSCPRRPGPGLAQANLARLTMRMSAVMAQFEKSSVSPTKMQICAETGAAIRALHLAAGREPPQPPPLPGTQSPRDPQNTGTSRQADRPWTGRPWVGSGQEPPPGEGPCAPSCTACARGRPPPRAPSAALT